MAVLSSNKSSPTVISIENIHVLHLIPFEIYLTQSRHIGCMDRLDLRSFVDRIRVLVDASPPTSFLETRSWLVDPLLEALGWDVHADSCFTDTTIADARLEYVLGVDSTPALFVAVEAYPDDLDVERARRLQKAMARTGVDRTLYTNGRQLVLVDGADDADHLTCPLTSIADREDDLAPVSRTATSRRLEGETGELAARRIAVRRSDLEASIVDDLTAIAGDRYDDVCRVSTERFLDHLVVSLVDSPPAIDGSTSADGSPAADGQETVLEFADPSTVDREGDAASDPAADRSAGDADEGEEYVVRFFNERGSIGAIGHAQSDAALVHAVEFLFDRGLSGLDVPFRSDDDEGTVLNDEPVCADGSPMESPRELSNGLYLDAGGDSTDRADRILALVERAGLRAMLTGAWSGQTR